MGIVDASGLDFAAKRWFCWTTWCFPTVVLDTSFQVTRACAGTGQCPCTLAPRAGQTHVCGRVIILILVWDARVNMF